jgi:hypothetical protein
MLLTKDTPGIQVCRQKLTVALHGRLGRETAHVGRCHELLEELAQSLGFGIDVDLVFPLELRPHCPELRLSALRGFDVVHDVHMDVVENDNVRINALLAVEVVSRVQVWQSRSVAYPSYMILPKMTPVSVDETVTH